MSGICGWVGEADPLLLTMMLAAIEYRGDRVDEVRLPGFALGCRWWSHLPHKSGGSFHPQGTDRVVGFAGSLAPPVHSPAAAMPNLLANPASLALLDGAFTVAWWEGAVRQLKLAVDPFGVRSLYFARDDGVFYFASELKQLLAVPHLPIRLDYR